MSNLRQALERLSAFPLSQTLPLLSLLWSGHADANEIEPIFQELLQHMKSLRAPQRESSISTTGFTLEKVPFWISALGSAVVSAKFPSKQFVQDLALPFLSSPPSITPSLPISHLENISRALVDQLVSIAAQEGHQSQIWKSIFSDIPHVTEYEIIAKHSKKKHQSAWKLPEDEWTLQLAVWACEKFVHEKTDIVDSLDAGFVSNYIDQLLAYLLRSKQHLNQHNMVIHRLLPNFVSKQDRTRLWSFLEKLDSQKEDHQVPKMIYAVLVQFYETFFPVLEKEFDIRSKHLFFVWILAGLSQKDDLVARRRAMYLLKRVDQSSASSVAIKERWIKFGENQADWNKFLLLLDSQENNDVVLGKLLWQQFDELLAFCGDDVRQAEVSVHVDFMRAVVERIFLSDSRPLRRYCIWSILNSNNPHIARLFSDVNFAKVVLAQVHDVLGNALAPQWIYDDLFPSFFSRALIASQSIPSTSIRTDLTPSLEQASTSMSTSPSSIIEAKRAYARSLLSFSLGGHSTGQKHAKAGITGQCLAVILSCFSGSSTSAFPLIDDALCYQLLNCFQSTFMGYLPTMQTLLFEKSLKAVSVWIDLASTSPNTLIQLIKSVPNFYAHKPTISHLLRQITALLDSANPRLRYETENTSSTISTTERAWTESFFVSKTLEVYTSQRHSTATRSTMAIRSFASVAETGNFLSMILRLFDPTTGASYLKIIFDTVMSKFSQDMIASTVFLASLWENARNVAKPIWALFAERHSQDIQKSNLSESLNTLLLEATAFFNAETHTADLKELNKTKDILASLSALSSIVPSLRTLGTHSALETTLYAIQTSTMKETSQTFLRLFAKLGAFSNADVISPLQANQLLTLIGKLVEFDWPREACVGVDGPTWKLLASEFEVARWTALSSLCTQVNHSLYHDSDQVTLIVEHCVSRCDAVSIENIPSLMHVVKTIFPLLINTEVSSATVDTYLNGMIRAMKQEKTFMSRQVYHLLGGVLTPAVLHCTRISNAVVSFLHQALSFADCSIGIANWLVQLIAASFENPSSDSEQHAIRLIPVLFNLAIFGPIRQSGLNPPSNIDLEIAGVKGEITDPFVRSTTISLLCSRLGNFTLFHTKLFRYALGQVDEAEESNRESNPSPAATLFLHVTDYTMAKGKAGAYRHLLNYRRFQLCSLISRLCDFDLLERCVWPLLHAEHVVSVRELVTLTASILVTRTLASDRSEVQLKLLSKMNEIVTTLQSESTTKLNEDSAFAWITIAGVVLQRVNLRTQPHLVSAWTSLFQLLLPFLTYNSLYLRGTVQELFLNTMKIKINDFSFLSNDFVDYLKSLNNFLSALLGARPLNRANRRELFYADFLKSYDAGVVPTEEQQREILRLVVVLHPEQHQMQSIELVSSSALDSSWKIATGALENVVTDPGSLIDHPEPIAEELRQKLVSEFLGITPQDVDKSSKAELSASSESSHNTTETPTDTSQMTFQRKILPWQSIDLKDDKASSSSSELGASELIALDKTQKVAKGRQELIVVATLLQKIPNFAGLTRTAEIFNASKLILPSLSIVKDKAFQDIAVTADQWLPIEEVTEADLPAWLRSQQKLGFSLIGVEQTSNSVSLVGYEFPQKTVLLLGEEKHGIPVELIQMLDKCVEIPQLGIIRSLNVHVSASIMIWEYTKQQLEAK